MVRDAISDSHPPPLRMCKCGMDLISWAKLGSRSLPERSLLNPTFSVVLPLLTSGLLLKMTLQAQDAGDSGTSSQTCFRFLAKQDNPLRHPGRVPRTGPGS